MIKEALWPLLRRSSAFLVPLLFLGCGGANPEVRTDRFLAEWTDKFGVRRLVVVSEGALAERPDGYNWFIDDHWTPLEIGSGMQRLVFGGTCRITGAVIPPMSPSEGYAYWRNLVRDCVQYYFHQNEAIHPLEAERRGREYVEGLCPCLVELTRQHDPELKLDIPAEE